MVKEIVDLFSKSVEAGKCYTSRKYIEINHPQLMNASLRHFKSWDKSLEYCGICPDNSRNTITASKTSKGGFAFQREVRKIFLKNNFKELKNHKDVDISKETSFCYNKKIDNCSHKKACQPDFYFKDFIVDTKIGGNALRQKDQMKRYFNHKENVIIVTLKDGKRRVFVDDHILEIINIKKFIELLNLKNVNFSELNTKLNSIKFYNNE